MKHAKRSLIFALALLAFSGCTKVPGGDDGNDIYNPDDPRAKLRLSEIATYDTYKYVEIWNPTGQAIGLEGISLWKNGEIFTSFSSSKSIPAGGYGVFRAKSSGITLPSGATDLGVTDTGLSGSKSLSVELRYGKTTIDAFANTINPGVAQMTVSDWDGEPEFDGTTFIRRAGSTDGWYALPSTTPATPGAVNGTSGTRLNHQLLPADAIASAPYVTNVVINPAKPTVGLTPANNVIRFSVYYDVFSSTPAIASTNGSPANVSGVVYEMTVSLSGSAAGTDTDITITAANSAGSYPEKITVLAFTDDTVFGSYENIRLNEIYTKSTDAIELYNTSDKPVVISGMRIRKNKESIFTIPGYMVMKAGAYAVLSCNGNAYNGDGSPLNLGTVSTGLSGSKSLVIELRRPKIEGNDNSTNIDAFVNIATSVSSPNKDSNWDAEGLYEHDFECAGRKPDGSGNWYVLGTPTIGKSNSAAAQGAQFTQSYHQ